jgi:AcrR family transcriptional regulator
MDQIAADAAVSRQTVYKQFTDKEQLFRDIVLGMTSNAEAIGTDTTSVLHTAQFAYLALAIPQDGRCSIRTSARPAVQLLYAAMTRECRVVTAFRAEVIAPCCQASM